jgi:hypothetical protein
MGRLIVSRARMSFVFQAFFHASPSSAPKLMDPLVEFTGATELGVEM